MTALLNGEVLSAIGRRSEPRHELVTRRDIRKYAVATGNRQRKYLDGDQAPPMFHVPLFWDVVELDQLTLTGGKTTGSGGGIFSYQSSVTLANLTISGNSADFGDGLLFSRSSVTV